MSINTRPPDPATEALYRLSLTLPHPAETVVALGLAVLGCAPEALLTLVGAEEDLLKDGRRVDLHVVVAGLTPHLTDTDRDRAWDSLTEAVQLAAEWSAPDAADVLADPLPYGTSADATTSAMVDAYEAQRDAALAALTVGAAHGTAVAA
jgi:hypothetical protein